MKLGVVLIDIQNDYFSGGKFELEGSIQASIQAGKLLDFFRQQQLPIFHLQHISIQEMTVPADYVHATSLAALNYLFANVQTFDEFIDSYKAEIMSVPSC